MYPVIVFPLLSHSETSPIFWSMCMALIGRVGPESLRSKTHLAYSEEPDSAFHISVSSLLT